MNYKVGDLLKRRYTDIAGNYIDKSYALVLEVDMSNNTVVCEFYPSGLVQGNNLSTMQVWYVKA